jgi:hypothetical protein
MLLLAGSAFALELEEPSIQEQTADVLPAAVATNETAVAQVILIIEDLAPATATVTVEIEDANAPSETLTPVPSKPVHVPDHAGVLSNARQYALGMIETGNNDGAIGGLGEVSRYQIMPSVWKHYSTSRSYRNLDVATEVARQHWTSLYEYFKNKTEREPTNFDMYVLWNTRHGHYAAKEFTPARLNPVIRDRAQRFANLVEDSLRRESELAMANPR